MRATQPGAITNEISQGLLASGHAGAYRDGAATAELTALGSSSGGALAGVSGGGDFIADPGGKVRLELTYS